MLLMSLSLSLSLSLSTGEGAKMMQRTSVLCSPSSNPLPFPPPSLCFRRSFQPPSRNRLPPTLLPSRVQLPSSRFQTRRLAIAPPQSTATREMIETSSAESGFVEIGYISRVHGLQGEICVKPTTDFPELRFSTPGKRWLKQQVSGRETVQEMELVDGRGHPGQKSWILKFEGIDTVEQAKQLIGSTLLVPETERPDLEEGEFYTRDLVGMRVINKETGEAIGTVVSVYNSGANDLLHVQLDSSAYIPNGSGKSKKAETGASDPLVWVPFVEAIVPDVDVNRREMFITPPKGLLELNLRSDEKSKKERRQLEWKERKKFQKRLIAAKKKLCELEQQHVFHGFRYGEKTQGRLLADQIIGVNSKLLQQALQNIQISPPQIMDRHDLLDTARAKEHAALRISEDCIASFSDVQKQAANLAFQETGSHLISQGKVAIVLVVDDNEKMDFSNPDFGPETIRDILHDQKLVKTEDRTFVPLVLISSSHLSTDLEESFMENDYFGFDSTKVWFLEEEMLPVVSYPTEEEKRHKILMKSPWEMLQSPVGSGGIITLFASHNMLENLSQLGVDYIQVCGSDGRYLNGQALLLGITNSRAADIGILIREKLEGSEESINMVLSVNFLKQLTKQINKLQFVAVPKPHAHVELVDKEWVDVIPDSPNSFEIRCSLYSCLDYCSSDKVCAVDITGQ